MAAPLASIVRRLTPPVTKAISSEAGDINPVLGSPSNFNAQDELEPLINSVLDPSLLKTGNPPFVIASCITTVFNEVSTVTSPSAPLKV